MLNFDLIGLNEAWRAALEPIDEAVSLQAIAFLNKLHKQVSPEMQGRLGEFRENYLTACMTRLCSAAAALAPGATEGPQSLRVQRCLTLLKTFIKELEGDIDKHGANTKGKPIRITAQVRNKGLSNAITVTICH